jgi:hypothetical protein
MMPQTQDQTERRRALIAQARQAIADPQVSDEMKARLRKTVQILEAAMTVRGTRLARGQKTSAGPSNEPQKAERAQA